jgi:hypothetical protein
MRWKPNVMIPRFVIYPLNHTILVLDVTEIGLPTGIYPPEGELKMVPSIRFHNWRYAEAFFVTRGARQEELEKLSALVKRGMIAVLTIA